MLQGIRKTLAEQVASCAERLGLAVFLVGGIVRDSLRGSPVHDCDLDFVVEGDAQLLAHEVHQQLGGTLKSFTAFYTAKIADLKIGDELLELDFASTRSELYRSPGALPEVQRAPTLRMDLERRDFSVNALALPLRAATLGASPPDLRAHVIDYFSGLDDLQHGVLRVLHAGSFQDDPTRILRGARYSARLSARFSADTELLARREIEARAMHSISWQRYYRELKFIFAEQPSIEALKILQDLGALQRIPELAAVSWGQFLAFLAAKQQQLSLNFPALAYQLFWALCYGLRLRQLADADAVDTEFKGRGLSRKGLQAIRLLPTDSIAVARRRPAEPLSQAQVVAAEFFV